MTRDVTRTVVELVFHALSADSCQVNNGQCDVNADCSHDVLTFAVKCTCKIGYTNTSASSSSNGSCTGMYSCLHVSLTAAHLCLCHSIDSCLVKNGNCDKNAVCSHDATTNAVLCTCKTGYTNTGSGSNVICTGEYIERRKLRCMTPIVLLLLDSCQVNNGGCDKNAICSHVATTNEVTCTCRTGFTNTGSSTSVNCTGMTHALSLILPSHHAVSRHLLD